MDSERQGQTQPALTHRKDRRPLSPPRCFVCVSSPRTLGPASQTKGRTQSWAVRPNLGILESDLSAGCKLPDSLRSATQSCTGHQCVAAPSTPGIQGWARCSTPGSELSHQSGGRRGGNSVSGTAVDLGYPMMTTPLTEHVLYTRLC